MGLNYIETYNLTIAINIFGFLYQQRVPNQHSVPDCTRNQTSDLLSSESVS